ncbi:MAG TPA: ATP-binding protein [Bacillota bacterium]|nr:ATP-binding protein [Bacillota bacterium]
MNLLSLAHYTTFLISIGLIIFILSKNPKAAANRICAALAFSYAIWNFAYVFFQTAASKPDAMFWENIASIGWCSFPALSIWLTLIIILKKSLLKKWYLYPLLLFCPAFFVYQQWTGALIYDLVKRPQWWSIVWSNSIWPWLYFAYNYFFMTIALFVGTKFVKKTRLIAAQKRGARLVRLVTIITLILGTITDVSLPLLNIYLIPPISSIILVILVGGMAYAISKYQFLTLTPAYAASDILGAMSDSLILIGPDGKIIEVNTSALNLLGYSREELIRQPVEILFSSHDASFFTEIVSHFQSKEGAFKDHRMFYRPKSGILIPVSFSGSVLRDPDRNLIGVIAVARDLRELLRLQANQRDYIVEKARAEALEERARELQAAYDKLKTIQAQLIQSEKMAAVGQLAGGMAHEINNPLGVILGFAQSITKRIPEADPLYRPLKSIEREAVRCKKLVGDLLTFSRAGKTQAEIIDINATIDETLSLIEAQTKVKDIEIIKDYTTAMPQITANKNQMQQVIMNLCNNAIDAMPNGGCLTICTRNNETQIQITISDTGHGMTEDVKNHLFEPFFTTKEIGKGTGLGLSLCYEIIRNHHGIIEVESEVGKGSAFKLKLPLHETK